MAKQEKVKDKEIPNEFKWLKAGDSWVKAYDKNGVRWMKPVGTSVSDLIAVRDRDRDNVIWFQEPEELVEEESFEGDIEVKNEYTVAEEFISNVTIS